MDSNDTLKRNHLLKAALAEAIFSVSRYRHDAQMTQVAAQDAFVRMVADEYARNDGDYYHPAGVKALFIHAIGGDFFGRGAVEEPLRKLIHAMCTVINPDMTLADHCKWHQLFGVVPAVLHDAFLESSTPWRSVAAFLHATTRSSSDPTPLPKAEHPTVKQLPVKPLSECPRNQRVLVPDLANPQGFNVRDARKMPAGVYRAARTAPLPIEMPSLHKMLEEAASKGGAPNTRVALGDLPETLREEYQRVRLLFENYRHAYAPDDFEVEVTTEDEADRELGRVFKYIEAIRKDEGRNASACAALNDLVVGLGANCHRD